MSDRKNNPAPATEQVSPTKRDTVSESGAPGQKTKTATVNAGRK